MKNKIITGLLIIISQFSFSQTPQTMMVKIDGLRAAVGQVMVFIYNKEEDFPTKRDRAFKSKSIPATALSLTVSFDEVPNGTYGVAVYHDENSNGKMDRHWYGTPIEGYGASNDATGSFGPPKFKDAKFDFKSLQDTVKIIIHY